MHQFVLSILISSALFAADPSGFGMWKAADLEERTKVLGTKVGADHSARETLGNYGNHLVRLLHRDADGAPELHEKFVDLWMVVGGEGTLVVGGTIVNLKPGSGVGEFTGTKIEGGENHAISTGDVIHIPPKTAHAVLVPKGKQITYLRIAIPAA